MPDKRKNQKKESSPPSDADAYDDRTLPELSLSVQELLKAQERGSRLWNQLLQV